MRRGIAQSVWRQAMGWTAGVRFLAGEEIFLYSTESRPALGPTQPSIQWIPKAASSEVKRPVRESDHSPPSSAEVKNGGAIPPLPIRLRGVMLN
jgi:hypothetical protein